MAIGPTMFGERSSLAGLAHDLAPGLYWEERVAPHATPRRLRTGIPVFVGFGAIRAPAGRREVPYRRLSRWVQFDHLFERSPGSYLEYAVQGFFENGGERCVVVPVGLVGRDAFQLSEALTEPFRQGGILEELEDVDLVCVPDAVACDGVTAAYDIQSRALEHCQRMGNRFAILDASAEAGGLPSVVEQRAALVSGDGALYYPWVHVKSRPSGVAATGAMAGAGARSRQTMVRAVPPCGHVAGVYARTDARVGAHKAPANEIIEGVMNLPIDLSDAEHAELNEAGVNCLRSLPGRGIRVWGVRTLSGQPDWMYVNVRRLFLTLARWLQQNMNDLLFEPHDPYLWQKIQHRASGYCLDLFDRGALAGQSPGEAFFVKCNAETNPAGTREAGLAIAEIGLAVAVPAEFVVVRITQSASGVTVTEPTGSRETWR
jgi:hypothetical protein